MQALYFANKQDVLRFFLEERDESLGVVLFCPADCVEELSRKAPEDTVLCSTSGEYTYEGYRNGVIAGFAYRKEEAEIVEIKHPAILSIDKLKNAYNRVQDNENAYMLLLCDGLSGMEESVIATFFFMRPDFKIIGGSAGDNLQFRETFIFIGSRRVHHAAVFFNSSRRTFLIKENIYTRTGETLLVTQADVLNRTVMTFNNEPASLEYARVLGIDEGALPDHFMNHPLGKAYADDIFIASPMKVNEDRSITFYSELMANTFVHMLKPEDPISTLKETLASIPCKPSFVLSIHCILRSVMFIREGYWESFDREMLQFCGNITGFISYGEQYYHKHANQTMLMLLVE